MFGFYLNHFEENHMLFNALKSIRAAYPQHPVAIQDDKSGPVERSILQQIADHFGNVTILPDWPNKMGWEGYYLVQYELQNYKRIFNARPDLTHLFKMDPDTVILGPNAESIISANPAADIIGKFCPVGFGLSSKPRTIVERAMINRGIDPSVWATGGVQGGGYFFRNNIDLLTQMIAAWNRLSDRIGLDKAYEDQCVSALTILCGGTRADSADLLFGRPASIPPTAFSIHPIKTDLARWQCRPVRAVLNGSREEYESLTKTN